MAPTPLARQPPTPGLAPSGSWDVNPRVSLSFSLATTPPSLRVSGGRERGWRQWSKVNTARHAHHRRHVGRRLGGRWRCASSRRPDEEKTEIRLD
ncbi:hypothetical protein E2C01_078259 [Portunus trituberculatus]|uniref:Uncharacterized protein n=1 Tax=Portunus trituberculatus TaxID=210409 RepID=A0A5B7IS90_PORTR|nr:hypothetical protein [Portunus trituberculatus]